MPYTLLPMRLSSTQWVGTKTTHTILLLRVNLVIPCSFEPRTDNHIAVSGACATTASDAIMNPFDGTRPCTGVESSTDRTLQ